MHVCDEAKLRTGLLRASGGALYLHQFVVHYPLDYHDCFGELIMRILIQRTTRAAVTVEGQCIASIDKGYLVFIGVGKADIDDDAALVAQKIVNLRLFEDVNGKTNLCLADVGGEILLVSQFTLFGDVRRGRRPGFSEAASPVEGERLYLLTAELLRQYGVPVQTGQFGAHMAVELCNDGPFTIWFDSEARN